MAGDQTSPKELQAIRQQGGDRPCLIGRRSARVALARTRDCHLPGTLQLYFTLLLFYCRSNLQTSAMWSVFFNPLVYL